MLICFAIKSTAKAESCNSCGAECKSACGTRHFRTCCFNYVKKRSNNYSPNSLKELKYEFPYYGPYGHSTKLTDTFDEKEKIKAYKNDETINPSNFDAAYNGKEEGSRAYQAQINPEHLDRIYPDQQLVFNK
jgi:hypothetical protein